MECTNSLTAVEAINLVTQEYNTLGENVSVQAAMGFLEVLAPIIEGYMYQVENTKVEVENLTQEQASDKKLNEIALKYNVTLNQLVGLMNLAEQLNKDQMEGTGLTVVPFWFHEQFIEMQKYNEKLIHETDNLMATLSRVKAHTIEAKDIVIPERTSIITGVQAPYIPGETGPRVGDEHLDRDNVYIDPRETDPRWRK